MSLADSCAKSKMSHILNPLTPITYKVNPFTGTNGYKKLTKLHAVYLICKVICTLNLETK